MSHANDNASADDLTDFDVMNIVISEFADCCYSSYPVEPVEAKPKKSGHQRRPDPKLIADAKATLITGDCLERLRQMATGSVCVMFFSPPYNKHCGGNRSNWRKTGAWKANTLGEGYASYSDDMPHEAYVEWMKAVLLECWRVVKDDGAIFFQHKDQHRKGVLVTPDELNPGLPLRQRIIWNRGSGMNFNASHLLPTFEYVYVFAKPKFKFGQCGTTHAVIDVAPDYGNEHPAPFPVELPRTIFKALRPTDTVICDPFSGSGSTGVAALAEGRNYIGIELDAGYNTKAAARLGCADPNVVPLTARLWLGDCLEMMKHIPDESVDLVACDLPYAALKSKWDVAVPMDALWAGYRRILKPSGTVVLTAAGIFAARLTIAGGDLYRYPLVWEKNRPTCPQHAASRPMSAHEDLLVFSKGRVGYRAKNRMTYNPQGLVERDKPLIRKATNISAIYNNGVGGGRSREVVSTHTNFPRSVQRFSTDAKVKGKAPETQKPVALMDWIIRTYSNEGEVVLDNTMGSGTTGVAALAAGRHFIGIELNRDHYETACARIRDHATEDVVFDDEVPLVDNAPPFFQKATARILDAAPELVASNDAVADDDGYWEAKRAAYRAAMAKAA